MDLAVYIRFCMVDHLMREVFLQSLVRFQRITVQTGSDLDRELPPRMARFFFAFPHPPSSSEPNISASTNRAYDTSRPAPDYKIVQAIIGISKELDRFLEGFGFACHDSSMP